MIRIFFGLFILTSTAANAAETVLPVKATVIRCTVNNERGCILCPGLTDYSKSPLPACEGE